MTLQLKFYDPEKGINVQPSFYDAYKAIEAWEKYGALVDFINRPKEKPADDEPVNEGAEHKEHKPHKAKAKHHK